MTRLRSLGFVAMAAFVSPVFGQALPPPAACYSNGHPWTRESLKACDDATALQEREKQQADAAREEKDQQTDDAKERAKIASAARIQAHASPALIAYEAKLHPMERDIALAKVANICVLRSEEWLEVIIEGFNEFAAQQAEMLHVSDEERSAADLDLRRNTAVAMPTRAICQSLVNSATMDRLDAVENRLTGGYH